MEINGDFALWMPSELSILLFGYLSFDRVSNIRTMRGKVHDCDRMYDDLADVCCRSRLKRYLNYTPQLCENYRQLVYSTGQRFGIRYRTREGSDGLHDIQANYVWDSVPFDSARESLSSRPN